MYPLNRYDSDRRPRHCDKRILLALRSRNGGVVREDGGGTQKEQPQRKGNKELVIEKSKCEPLGLCLLFLVWCDIMGMKPEGTGINRNL